MMKTRTLAFVTVLATAIVLSLTTYPPVARADTHTWFNNAKGYWSDPANWDENVVPSPGDMLVFEEPVFGGGVRATNDLAPGTVFNTIVFDGCAPTQGLGLGIYGNAIGLTGGIVASNLYGPSGIHMDITLQGSQTFNCPKTTVYGDINLNGSKLTVEGVTLSGVVQGVGSLEKTGKGGVTLSGSSVNTYTGATVVKGGSLWLNKKAGNAIPGALEINSATVQLLSADQIADSQPVSVNSAGLLDLNTFSETIGALAMSGGSVSNGTLTLNGNVTGTSSASGAARISGNLNLGAVTRTFDIADGPQAPDVVLDAVVSGRDGLTKQGSGSLQLAGVDANTYPGATTVNAGVLQLNKSAGIAAIRGALQVSGGPVQWLATDQIPDDVPIAINSNGYLQLNNQSEAIGPLTLMGGWITTGAGVLSLTTNVTGSGGQIDGYLSLGNADRTFEVSGFLYIIAHISGTGGISKTGLGSLSLSGSNSFWGTTVVQAGELQVRNDFALGSATAGTVVQAGSSLFLSPSVHVPQEPLTLFGGAKLRCWTAWGIDSGWGGPITLLGSASIDAQITTPGGTGTLRLSGAIDGPGGFIKTGNRCAVVLSGPSANTYAGETRVSVARLELAKAPGVTAIPGPLFIETTPSGSVLDLILFADEQIADSAPVTLGPQAVISLGGFIETIGSLSGGGWVDVGTSSGNLIAGANGSSTEYSGRISGHLTKAGAGTLNLSGLNTSSASYTVTGGVLWVNGSHTLADVGVPSGGTLGGTGEVAWIILTGGTLNPGTSAGRLTCGALGLSATAPSTCVVELNGTTPGSGYDQLKVNGSANLSQITLDARLGSGFVPPPGTTFTLIDNDGVDPVVGTFQGLPEGAEFAFLDGQLLRISYRGGSGNDVVLTTLEPRAGLQASVRVLGGNGNGVVDPRECNHLEITLTNGSPVAIANVTATLACTTPGAQLWQSNSACLQIPARGKATNQPLLLLSTAPSFPCNADMQLALTLSAAGYGSCTMPLTLRSGCADGGGECVACPPGLAVRRVGNWPGFLRAPAYGVQVVGTVAYVADGSAGLQILDVSNPGNVTRLGGYDTSGDALDVQVVGTVAYVADYGAGLQILDVSNPAKVTRLGGFDTSGYASAVQVVGTVAYVADGQAGLQILDVSNPANVTRLGGYDSGYAQAVQVLGTVAYVADYSAGLRILDVSNPANVTRLGGYHTETGGYPLAFHVVGTVAYVAGGYLGLLILDVSNPANVRRLGGCDTSGSACGVQVAGNYAYVADGAGGLAVFTFTPVPLLQISPPASGQCCLRVEGYPASPTVVESAPSLTPPIQWTVVLSNSMPVLPLEFNAPATAPQRFYRARQQCR